MKTLANKFNKWGLGKETMREAQMREDTPCPLQKTTSQKQLLPDGNCRQGK